MERNAARIDAKLAADAAAAEHHDQQAELARQVADITRMLWEKEGSRTPQVLRHLKGGCFDGEYRDPTLFFTEQYKCMHRVPKAHLEQLLVKLAGGQNPEVLRFKKSRGPLHLFCLPQKSQPKALDQVGPFSNLI